MVASKWFAPAGLLLLSQWEIWIAGQTHPSGPLWVTAVSCAVAAAMLVWRRDRPLSVQLAAVAVTVPPWLFWGAPQNGSQFLIGLVATYAVGRWADRPTAFLGVPVVIGWSLGQLALDPLQESVASGWGWALWGVGAWAAGAWVRQHAELEDRRDGQREAAARAMLAEQRLDIARDLHDVLANSLGVVILHAEAAEALIPTDPDRAAEAMRRVQSTGRDALRDVRVLLGVLRNKPDLSIKDVGWSDLGGRSTEAAGHKPDVDDIDELVERMRAAGLRLSYHREGHPVVPSVIGQVIYRLVQEALSNVVRHAGLVPTSVILRVGPDAVLVQVTNEASLHGDDGDGRLLDGNGLTGMQERLRAVGGTLEVCRPPGGGLQVRAKVPLPASDVPEAAAGPDPSDHRAALERPR